MSRKESDPIKAERKQISLSSFIAIELVNDLTEFERRQNEHASEIKKRIETLVRPLKYIGVFSKPERNQNKYKRTHEKNVIIKLLDFDEIELENATFTHDLWLSEKGKLFLYGIVTPSQDSHQESREVFTEASNAEYIMLFPFVLRGVGDEVARALPQNT